jgi:sugar-phosphatase
MQTLCSAENEEFGKPHPAVFITAAKKLGVAPDKCLIIEDSPSGVIAARAAKGKVIAIPEAHNFDKPEMGIADIVLTDLTEISQKCLTI